MKNIQQILKYLTNFNIIKYIEKYLANTKMLNKF